VSSQFRASGKAIALCAHRDGSFDQQAEQALDPYALVMWTTFGLLRVDGNWTVTPWLLEESVRESADKVSKVWLSFVSFSGTVVTGYLISLLSPRPSAENIARLNWWDQNG
jgi:hypothetical protein